MSICLIGLLFLSKNGVNSWIFFFLKFFSSPVNFMSAGKLPLPENKCRHKMNIWERCCFVCHWEEIRSGGKSLVLQKGNGQIFNTKARLF